MASSGFDRAFDRLVRTFFRYKDAPRSPEEVVDLASRRSDLDDARDEMRLMSSHDRRRNRDPATVDWVDPSLGTGSPTRIGIMALFITVAFIGIAIFGAMRAKAYLGSDHGLHLVDGTTRQTFTLVDDRCRWRVSFVLVNETTLDVTVLKHWVAGQPYPESTSEPVSIPIGGKASGHWEGTIAECPEPGTDAERSGRLIVRYEDSSLVRPGTVELGF